MAVEGFDMTFVKLMTSRLPNLLERARANGVLVIFVRNVYNASPNLYLSDVWLEQAARKREGSYITRPVCVAGSWGADFLEMFARWRLKRLSPSIVTARSTIQTWRQFFELTAFAPSCSAVVQPTSAFETSAREAFLRDYYVVLAEDGAVGYSPRKARGNIEDD